MYNAGDEQELKARASEAIADLLQRANGLEVTGLSIKFNRSRHPDEPQAVIGEIVAISSGTVRLKGHSKPQTRKGRY